MVSVFGGDIALENQRRTDTKIQRRRERNEARRMKLLNAKTRLMGVDKTAIDIQIEEKKRRNEAERQAEKSYANRMSQIQNILEERNLSDNEQQVEEAMKTRAVWDVQQQQLNERSMMQTSEFEKKWSDESVVGAASMRNVAGEDRYSADRKKMQAMQMKDWCAQISAENVEKKRQEQEEMMRHSNYLMQVDSMRQEMNKIETEQRMADNLKTAQTNAQLADMRRAERAAEAERVRMMDLLHSENIKNNPMLCEARDQAKSVIEGRVRRDHWKGMSVSQLQAIQAENYRVIMEKRDRDARERNAEVCSLFLFLFSLLLFCLFSLFSLFSLFAV